MPEEFEAGLKPLPTVRTLIGTFPSVDHPVDDELRVADKALPTVPTFVRPLPSVDAPVDDEVGVLLKLFPQSVQRKGLSPE
ncbi:hypothetical protein WISP_65800 [Willisornis vidua]|uniref:Uncharacterized protein n=1 Tax=Willisornis vidua TaxID=1566151 RepID=A0ABQ9DEX0_9PASS|nr:hypothetical protein WISP_65800 [Willisornis vidua]